MVKQEIAHESCVFHPTQLNFSEASIFGVSTDIVMLSPNFHIFTCILRRLIKEIAPNLVNN